VVKRDGTIENIRFLKSSGSPEAEEAAIMAVQGAAPFQNLPDGSRKREQITFSFETQE
jgi:TonB family protein